MSSPREFPLKNLWLVGFLLPGLSGLFYGGWVKAWLLLAGVAVGMIWWRRLRLPNAVLILGMSLGLLSLLDSAWNWVVSTRPAPTLFQPTDIPQVNTYLPGLDTTVSLLHCRQSDLPLYGDSCQDFHFSTNELGFRRVPPSPYGHPGPLREPNPIFSGPSDSSQLAFKKPRVLFLGDSFGVGMCDDRQSIPGLLEEGGFPSENLSVSGHGPWEEWQLLKGFGDKFSFQKGDILVWQLFEANDLDGPFAALGAESAPPSFSSRYRMFRLHSPLRSLVVRASASLFGFSPYPGTRLRQSTSEEWVWIPSFADRAANRREDWTRHPNWERFRETLEAGINWAREREMEVLLVNVPPKESVIGPWLEDKFEATGAFDELMREFATEHAVEFLPLFDPLSRGQWKYANGAGPAMYWKADIHLRPEGNEVAAQHIAQRIRSLQP